MLNIHDGTVEKTTQVLDEQLKQSAQILISIPGLPAQLKRDLRDLLQNHAGVNFHVKKETRDNVVTLLQLYERALKLMSLGTNGLFSHTDKINELSNQLQHLITELDFDGEIGDRLFDIRRKLRRHPNAQILLTLTLESVILILDGSRNERKISESFLFQLNNDLSLILRDNSYSINNTQAITTDRNALNVQLQSSVDTLQKARKGNVSLASLQQSLAQISLQISAVAQQINELNQKDEALLEKRRHNDYKLDTLYHKTKDYRHKLTEKAHTLRLDPLTKVHNRAAFDDRIEDEYRCWLRNQTPFSLAIVDIDHFKNINENYGPSAGDKVLKAVALTLHQCLRENDFLARFGGEEFVILLPEANDKTRVKILEKVCESVACLPFKFKDKPLTVTVSIGASVFDDAGNTLDLLDRADRALYRAKNNGRNQVDWA